MRLRNITFFVMTGVIAALIAALPFRRSDKLPRVGLLHLTPSVANPTHWSVENILDGQPMWMAEFEICNPDGSGVLFSHDKVEVQFLDATGSWRVAVPTGNYQTLAGLLHESESIDRISMRRIQVTVPSGTQRCRLVVRLRPLTAQERCREGLARSGFWRRFPKASAWLGDRLPTTKHWREWHPEIDLPRVLIERDVHSEAPALNPGPLFPHGARQRARCLVCAHPASPATMGGPRRWVAAVLEGRGR